jgi:hypothetical protein
MRRASGVITVSPAADYECERGCCRGFVSPFTQIIAGKSNDRARFIFAGRVAENRISENRSSREKSRVEKIFRRISLEQSDVRTFFQKKFFDALEIRKPEII